MTILNHSIEQNETELRISACFHRKKTFSISFPMCPKLCIGNHSLPFNMFRRCYFEDVSTRKCWPWQFWIRFIKKISNFFLTNIKNLILNQNQMKILIHFKKNFRLHSELNFWMTFYFSFHLFLYFSIHLNLRIVWSSSELTAFVRSQTCDEVSYIRNVFDFLCVCVCVCAVCRRRWRIFVWKSGGAFGWVVALYVSVDSARWQDMV